MAKGGTKRKVTLSLDSRLLDAIDRQAKGSRSGAIEKVLQEWYRVQQLEQLNQETEQYYRALSHSETLENEEWAKVSSSQAPHLWDV